MAPNSGVKKNGNNIIVMLNKSQWYNPKAFKQLINNYSNFIDPNPVPYENEHGFKGLMFKIIKEELVSEGINIKKALDDFEKKWLKKEEFRNKGIKHLKDALENATGPLAKQDYGLLGMSEEDLQQHIDGLKQLIEKYS